MVEQPLDDPGLKALVEKIDTKLAKEARGAIYDAINRVVAEGDLMVLGALGVDGRQKILDVFIEECQKLKEEFSNE